MKNRVSGILGLAVVLALSGHAARAVDVTVYNEDLALIKDVRPLTLKKGTNEVRVDDVAAAIDATSVHFKSLSDPEGTAVIEQNFQYDLLNQEKLLEKYLGKEIELERIKGLDGDKREVIKGTLLSNVGGTVLKVGNKIYLNPPGNPILPELPEGLVIKPTLLWQIASEKAGEQRCEISYLTSAMSWQSDYVVVTSPKDDQLDLNAWVTVNNNSGAAYRDAKLKLIAGDVNRAPHAPPAPARFKGLESDVLMEAKQFSEKSFFEYHLYTLERRTTLLNNETKQIEMAAASNVPLKKKFIYDGAENIYWNDGLEYAQTDSSFGTQSNKKVWVFLEFKNSKENNLGLPLPKGRVRVYKKDTDGALEFIGEDGIDHTAKDETVRVKMGNAFDLVGERKRTDFQSDQNHRSFTESFEIKVRNHKDEAATVNIVEHLYRWNRWKIVTSTAKYAKKDAQTIEFETPIAKDGEATITYTVKYSW